METNLIDWLTK